MSHLKAYCEVTIDTGEIDDEGNAIYQKDFYWLLHFGLRWDIVNETVVNYTTAICQHCKTGQIEMFDPTQIKIIGREVKE